MDYHLDEFVRPALLFAFAIVGLILSGLVESRVESRHAEELGRLGGGRVLVPPSRDSFSKGLRWMRFTSVGHFRLSDTALSLLCVLLTVAQAAFLGLLLGSL